MPARGYDPEEAARLRQILMESTGLSNLPNINNQDLGGYYKPQGIPDDLLDLGINVDDYFVPGEDWSDAKTAQFLTNYDSSPVPLTDVPTSSTSANRPRTVAAGWLPYAGQRKDGTPYAEQLGKMTVMFRDGTLYNYYDVTPGEWSTFRSSISKGRPFLNRKNQHQGADGIFIGKPRGIADMSNVSESVRRNIYRIARTAQVQFKTARAVKHTLTGQFAPEKGSATREYSQKTSRGKYTGYVSQAGAKRAGLSRRGYGTAGQNPHKNNGKNPN